MIDGAPLSPLSFEVQADEEGLRLDVVLVRRVPAMSRKKAREMVEGGEVHLNGRPTRKGGRVQRGDRVTLARAPSKSEFAARPDFSLDLHVVHEDDQIVVVDKPAGMPSHPLREDEVGTVASALVARYPEMALVGYAAREPGILHRLDTDTSGLMIAARDEDTFESLRTELRAQRIDKRYRALVEGPIDPREIDRPISPVPGDARRVRVGEHEGARPARTEIVATRPHGRFTEIEVSARAATRHQIRVHLASIGRPLAGDALYGGPVIPGLSRHFLHASEIRLVHPVTGARQLWRSALPRELEDAILRAQQTR
jgi:23S rRNA pseudouridine1911/1915/1917 synthase